MATLEDIRRSYNDAAAAYRTAGQSDIPMMVLENELVGRALGDCTGFRVLDLAGGSGGHARQAIKAGATLIDLVDISPGMLQLGKEIEAEARRNIIRWHEGNIIPPLSEAFPSLPRAGYDLVMAIYSFDHCHSLKDLEGMWQNASAYLKPNGKFIAARMGNPYAESAKAGKYGVKWTHIQKIPDGVKFSYTLYTDSPSQVTIEASSMESNYSGCIELPEKYGITDYRVLDRRETDTVRADPQFWEQFCKDPHFVVFTARKK